MARSIHIHSSRVRSLLYLLSLTLPPLLAGQTQDNVRDAAKVARSTIQVTDALRDSSIRLPHQFIIEASDTLIVPPSRLLQRGKEYALDARAGRVRFDGSFVDSLLASSGPALPEITISYRYLPFEFKDSYTRRQTVVFKDTARGDTLTISRVSASLTVEDIFGPDLQKSGSLVRGFTVGTNRDFSLTSGLRLQLSGKISSDVDVAAALTDENTPIQPEGTTQSLQEFDKVFVEIKSTNLGATLGDFNLGLSGTEFARISRKLQGAQATGLYRSGPTQASAVLAGAFNRGKFNTNQFNGLDGVQGPYRLTNRDGKSFIIVIAGTEKVYVDGVLQTRGETNDYIIDYSTGELTFSPRRLITAASRVVVDFEYSEQMYSRSLVAGQGSSSFFDEKAQLTVTYLREADDPDSPVDITLNDSARTAIENAGNDPSKAFVSGVTEVDAKGLYVQVDTVLSTGGMYQFYRYAPGDTLAKYNVSFSFAGQGKGEYVRQRIGVFEWRGPGGGDYLPVIFLPLPESHQVMDVALNVAPVREMKLEGEYARSIFDPNRLSSIGNSSNGGNSFLVAAAYAPKEVIIGGGSVGDFDIRFRERYVEANFVFIDRANDIEFNRKWGLDTLLTSSEEQTEVSAKYMPLEGVSAGGGYGKIRRGGQFNSNRFEGFATVGGGTLPTGSYDLEDIRSDDWVLGRSSDWFRQKGFLEYGFWHLTPVLRIETEKRTYDSLATGAIGTGSFAFDAYSAGLGTRDLGNVAASAEFSWRRDDAYNGGAVQKQSQSFTQSYSGKLSDWNALSSSVDVTLRSRRFTPTFQLAGSSDVSTVLVRGRIRYVPLNQGVDTDLFYEVQTERSSRPQRTFVKVPVGQGNYRYLGDLNNNGVADPEEFIQVRYDGDYVVATLPSDLLLPTINLQTSARLRIVPRRFLTGSTFLEEMLSALSAESYIRVNEITVDKEIKEICLLNFDRFQQDSTTISGTNLFTQDLYILDGNPRFSSRIRYARSSGLNNYSGGPERSYGREFTVRLRWQLVPEISNQLDFSNRIAQIVKSPVETRLQDILSNQIAFDVSYRPEQNLEMGITVSAGRSTDRHPADETVADLNTESLRLILSILGEGQLRVTGSREEVGLSTPELTYPYALTGGRLPGLTWLWGGALEYRIVKFIQATVGYEGRSEGARPPVHTGRAEVRAFF